MRINNHNQFLISFMYHALDILSYLILQFEIVEYRPKSSTSILRGMSVLDGKTYLLQDKQINRPLPQIN